MTHGDDRPEITTAILTHMYVPDPSIYSGE
jgi:hypothetical protein